MAELLSGGTMELFPTGEQMFTSENGKYMSLRSVLGNLYFMNATEEKEDFNALTIEEKMSLFMEKLSDM